MRSALLLAALLLSAIADAQSPPATAAHSPLVWDVRDGTHPKLGPIRVAVPAASVVTPVGKERILSLVFFSCEKSRGRIAIELANAAESDARSGLYPKQMPRMFCNPRSTAPRVELASTWFVSEIGDAMARGFAPSDLRRCASIDIAQDIALPRGWAADAQHIEIELIPYKRELESVLAACAVAQPVVQAERPKAPAASTPPPAAVASPPKAAPAPASPKASPRVPELPWKTARTAASGRTNVRARPSLDSPVVAHLEPGTIVQVQATDTDWWKVKPRGYVRQDRLSFQ